MREQYDILADKSNLPGIVGSFRLLGSFLPQPRPGLEGGTKGRRRGPSGVHSQAGGRWEARLPLRPSPPVAPLPGGGHGAPQGEVPPGRRPSSEARAESGQVPLTDAKRDFGFRGTRSVLSPAGLAGGSLPGEHAPLSVPPQTSARRRGRRGSRGGLTRRSWLISS